MLLGRWCRLRLRFRRERASIGRLSKRCSLRKPLTRKSGGTVVRVRPARRLARHNEAE